MQLHMVWSKAGAYRHELAHGHAGIDRVNASIEGLVSAYTIRTFRDEDHDAYIALMRAGGFETWSEGELEGTIARSLPNGVFFIEHTASGAIVATASSQHRPTELHRYGGEVGWVVTHPDHRGKRLGKVATACAVRRFVTAEYERIYLSTDDWRLPAIKIYFDLGFRPLDYAMDMPDRWAAVCSELGIPEGEVVSHDEALS